jgi:hypothetical protein
VSEFLDADVGGASGGPDLEGPDQPSQGVARSRPE